jgi:DNA-directed RNA polymerase specialized sigma24 family protein
MGTAWPRSGNCGPHRSTRTLRGFTKQCAGTPAFEFQRWMAFLESHEQEALRLRFIEECEYHEISAAQAIPIGTAQSRVFNAKRKLATHLKNIETKLRTAA